MSAFETVLRQQVMNSERALLLAERVGDGAKVSMHRARLLDLLDRAVSNGVDATRWISAELNLTGPGAWS